MKNSINIIWRDTIKSFGLSLSLIILLITTPSFGQTVNNFKSSSPNGENIIISMMENTIPRKNSYIQIYNADVNIINLENWSLIAIANGNEVCTWSLSGTIKPGESKTAGSNRNRNFSPDFTNSSWKNGNNKWDGKDDGAKLYYNSNLIDNAYSTINWSDGVLLRNEDIGNANTNFTESEWSTYSTSFDETSHNCRLPIIDIGPGLWSELTTDFAKGASYNIKGDVEVDIANPAECYSIYIQKDNTLSIRPLAALTINKNLNNYAGNAAFTIKANSSGSGSVIIYGISDNGTMEQYFDDIKLQNWKFISSPVRNAKSAIYENDYLMYYYEPQMRYVSITPSDVNLKVGRGYTVKKSQDSIEKYEGIFNSGEVKIPTLTNTLGVSYSTDGYSGWNLIGNPYTSSIDWDKVELPSKVNGQVSVWVMHTENGETVYDWKVWVKSFWSIFGFGDPEAHYIAPGEGFFVFSNDMENISFDSSVQLHHFTENNTKNVPTPVLNEAMEIKASGNNFSSSFYLRFLDDAKFDFDPQLDAFKRLTESKKLPQIYNKLEETILAANSIPHPAEDDILHLAFTCGTEGAYKLDFIGIDGFDYEQNFYLKDNISGEITNLRQEQTIEFNYKFSDPENRFDLLFGLVSGTNDLEKDKFGTNIYQSAGNIYIKTNYPQKQNLKVEIKNLLGQSVYSSKTINDFTNGKDLNLPNATYLVSIIDKDYYMTKKVAVYK
ncbi:MAG: hypothetical protein DRI74_07165 [Bacteroidetes bacterium]|nr:MAG: hypothetical protein DRI74_07165 [Bacteroidota bacterium]